MGRPKDVDMSTPERPERKGANSCCCQCDQPAHKRSGHGERCARCGNHRAPGGRIRWVDDDWSPDRGDAPRERRSEEQRKEHDPRRIGRYERRRTDRRHSLEDAGTFAQRATRHAWKYALGEDGRGADVGEALAPDSDDAADWIEWVREKMRETAAHRSPEPAAEPALLPQILRLARAYGSACANHEHDKGKPGGRERDRRQVQWRRLQSALTDAFDPSAEPATGRDRSQGVTGQELASAGGEPRYTLAEVADLIERREYGPGIGEEGLAIARWLRSGGATTETEGEP
jgi:hypothetical protein